MAAATEAHGRPIELVKTTEYRGRTIEVYRAVEPVESKAWHRAEERWVTRNEHAWYDRILPEQGERVDYVRAESLHGHPDRIVKRAQGIIDGWDRDDEIYDRLVDIQAATLGVDTWATVPESVEAGDVVAVYSRGQLRPAMVDKVTRTGRVTVAYVTRGGLDQAAEIRMIPGHENARATITRKAAPLSELRVRG